MNPDPGISPVFPSNCPAMKRTSRFVLGALCAGLLLLPAVPAWAQSNAKPPTQMTYQGFLTDGNGTPFGNTAPVNKTVIFRIYDNLTGGTLKWSSQQVVTVDKGYFSVLLGQGSAVGSEPFNADLTGVFTGAGASDRYLELNADGTTIAPRLRFLPAPSAMLAKSATELLDPVTGASALSVSGGAISGSGASLTSLNANQITSGTLSNARTTATSSGSANSLMARDGAGGFAAEFADLRAVRARGAMDSHPQGAHLEWNKDGNNGMTYLLNQRGNGGGGIVFGEATTGNDWQETMRITSNGNVGIGTGAPTARLQVNGAVAATSFAGNGTIPVGGIIMWSGAISAIPAGWALCDGNNGTPNLKDRFVVGAGNNYGVNATGGATTQSLNSGNLPSFSINYNDIYYSENGGSVSVPNNRGSGDTDGDNRGYEISRTASYSGNAAAFSIMPPYYSLAFIMRVQ